MQHQASFLRSHNLSILSLPLSRRIPSTLSSPSSLRSILILSSALLLGLSFFSFLAKQFKTATHISTLGSVVLYEGCSPLRPSTRIVNSVSILPVLLLSTCPGAEEERHTVACHTNSAKIRCHFKSGVGNPEDEGNNFL